MKPGRLDRNAQKQRGGMGLLESCQPPTSLCEKPKKTILHFATSPQQTMHNRSSPAQGTLSQPVGRPQTHHSCYSSYAGLTPLLLLLPTKYTTSPGPNCSAFRGHQRHHRIRSSKSTPSASRTSYWPQGHHGKGNIEKLQKLQI